MNFPARSGKLAAELRRQHSITGNRSRSAIAVEIGTTRNYVSNIFEGKMLPRDAMLRLLAGAMNLDPEPLLKLRDEDERIEIANGIRKTPLVEKNRERVLNKRIAGTS